MNIVHDLAQYLQDQGVATLGQDMFISRAPTEERVDNNIYWLKANGGVQDNKFDVYSVQIYYRDINPQCVYDNLQTVSDLLTCNSNCFELTNFDIVSVEAVGFHSDQDLDNEKRTVGLLQVNITTYKGECNVIS